MGEMEWAETKKTALMAGRIWKERDVDIFIRTFLVRLPSSFLPPWLSALGWFLT
jgi:hypothetical protein